MGPRTVGRREKEVSPHWLSLKNGSRVMVPLFERRSTDTPVRARGIYTQACAVTHTSYLRYIRMHIYTHMHRFTREQLARVRYICLSSSFLLHLSPFAYLMLFFRPCPSRLSLPPVSLQRYYNSLCSTRDWGLEATGRLACENNLLIVLYLLRPSINDLCTVPRL